MCCGRINRGVAIHGDTLFMGTIDAHLLAIDARNGRLKWDVQVADPALGYALTLAPLIVKDKVVIGPAGGEYGIRGFIAAYDVENGNEEWRFNTVPGPGEPGSETWEREDSWRTGGGSIWVTGSYDPELDLMYWGVGNPDPTGTATHGPETTSNTDSVVALDPDTGELQWHYQFTPHDEMDYDAVQVPVLADMTGEAKTVRVMLWANRNGLFYVFDRTNGEFLHGSPSSKSTG